MNTPIPTDGPVSSNGSSPTHGTAATPDSAAEAVAFMRKRPRNVHLAGGFGPLLLGALLFLLMLWAAPSVAPERVVQRPATSTSTSTTAPAPTTAPTTTVPAP